MGVTAAFLIKKKEIDACIKARQALGGTSLEQVSKAVKDAKKKQQITVRDANLDDVEVIAKLVQHWATVGENLPRAKSDMVHSINEFAVTEIDCLIILVRAAINETSR